MNIDVLTLFPEMFAGPLDVSTRRWMTDRSAAELAW